MDTKKDFPLILQLDGGIGRILCATPALEKLAQRLGDRRLIVLTSHPEVLLGNPHIYKVYGLHSDYLWEDVIRHGEFVYPEPYHSHFYYNQHHHLIQTFNYLLNKCDEFSLPKIYLTTEEVKWGIDFVVARKEEHKDKSILVLQSVGAGASIQDDVFKDETYRSLPQDKLNFLLNDLKDCCIFINASHIPVNHEAVWQQTFTLRQLFSIISACDFFVGVDSFASHAAAALDKSGILMLGSTYAQNVGYERFTTVTKEGYPKAYYPNRFGGGLLKQNEGAMHYSDDKLLEVAQLIRAIAQQHQKHN
jgi:hypothetical protein